MYITGGGQQGVLGEPAVPENTPFWDLFWGGMVGFFILNDPTLETS